MRRVRREISFSWTLAVTLFARAPQWNDLAMASTLLSHTAVIQRFKLGGPQQ